MGPAIEGFCARGAIVALMGKQTASELEHTSQAAGAAHNGMRGRSVGEVVRLALCADVARLVASDAAARLGEDPEGVHQARVASRRLRSQLSTFQPVLRRAPIEQVSKDLRWLGRHLGAVRDLDVLRDLFTSEIKSFEPLEREDALRVLAALDAARSVESVALHELLRSPRYRELLGSLGALVADPPFRRSAGLPAAPFLAEALYERFATLEAKVASLPTLPADSALHEVRIEAKPLRYAASSAAKVLGPACGRLARRVTELCDELGRLNDGARAKEWLDRTFDGEMRSTPVVRLHGAEIVRMADARAAWALRWDRVLDAAREMAWPIVADAGA
jgi:CHAD domain-containing protein